jgi:hypothetical protein
MAMSGYIEKLIERPETFDSASLDFSTIGQAEH